MAQRALTKAQRQWIIDRDGGKCVLCMSTHSLHVHHIIGHRVLHYVVGGRTVPEHPLNLITVCRRCHIVNPDDHMSTIHPDISYAVAHGIDFSKVFARRDRKLKREVVDMPLWNHEHDGTLVGLAVYNTLNYVAQGYEWPG